MLFFLYPGKYHNDFLEGDYYPVENKFKCHLFSSSTDNLKSVQSFNFASRRAGLTCEHGDSIWITYNKTDTIISILKCNGNVRRTDTICSVLRFREDKNE